jgi:hypothetical protein
MYPEIQSSVKRVLYDSACDNGEIKGEFENNLGDSVKSVFQSDIVKIVAQIRRVAGQ